MWLKLVAGIFQTKPIFCLSNLLGVKVAVSSFKRIQNLARFLQILISLVTRALFTFKFVEKKIFVC